MASWTKVLRNEIGYGASKVKNSYGAMGLMQVVPRFHPEKIKAGETLLDPDVNVRVGAQILNEYLRWHEGELNAALKRYSGVARNYARDVLTSQYELVEIGEAAEVGLFVAN